VKTIGKYIVRGLLGRGGMARVYKVEIPIIRKIAALKRLAPNPLLETMMGREKLHQLFVSEAITMANLRHRHIVEIRDFEVNHSAPFYIMDYFAHNLGERIGESYQTDLPSRVIAPDKAIDYTRQILSGLARLHAAGIIHRDIKPFNLLITDDDTVKICDFGLSKLRGETFSGPGNVNVGSPWYAAPEQEADPNQVRPAADIYPVGVMLYRMLTGRLPQTPREPVSHFNSDLDTCWDHMLARALATDPGQRYQSAAAMRQALDAIDAHWQDRKQRVCRLAEPAVDAGIQSIPKRSCRQRPIKIGPDDARRQLGLDALWRPEVWVANQFEQLAAGVVVDRATDLMWQQSGSVYPVTWPEAAEYIRQLNQMSVAGQNRWRLPTVDELATLLTPLPSGTDFCVQPVFDARQRQLWSCDRKSFVSAWYIHVEMGFVGWLDFTASCYVRAVCIANGPLP